MLLQKVVAFWSIIFLSNFRRTFYFSFPIVLNYLKHHQRNFSHIIFSFYRNFLEKIEHLQRGIIDTFCIKF